MADSISPVPGAPASGASDHGAESHGSGNRLGSFLCWAVVFADIGTSVYYTPGILYGQYSTLAGLFVVLTLSVFILLTLKYAEVTERFPEGGGVVTVASRAFGPWIGALGGMLILVDYFLTAAISSLSGLTYFAVVAPATKPFLLWITIVVLALLGLLNWYGIRESASVSAVIALLAFLGEFVVVVLVFIHVPLPEIGHLFSQMFSTKQLTITTFIAGFAGAFLAFSGLESISQLSPVMRVPRNRVAGWALGFVVITVGLTSPLLTVFSTTLLCAHGVIENGVLTCVNAAGQMLDPNQFISLLGGKYGGAWIGGAVAVSASALLIFASNTAIIGSYHVFLALTRMQFFPKVLIKVNRLRGTPHWAIGVATLIPIVVLVAVNGQINFLGDLYAFGLLGAFTVTCLGIDVVRWREHRGAARYYPTAAQEEAELRAQQAADALRPPSRLTAWYRALDVPGRARPLTAPLAAGGARVASVMRSWLPRAAWQRFRARYGWRIKFGLGVLTTALVAFAWSVNLVDKRLATIFGGGVTLLGLGIAFGYQVRKALPTVYAKSTVGAMPNAWLVVLPVGSAAAVVEQRAAVVRAAARGAGGRPLVFLYLQPHRDVYNPALFEINDPYARDQDAQAAFSRAAVTAEHAGVPYRAQRFIYRQGGDYQLVDVWRALKPEEAVAAAGSGLGRVIRAAYVRQDEEEAGVKFYGYRGGLNPAAESGQFSRSEEGPSVAVMGVPARLHQTLSAWLRGLWAALTRRGASAAPAEGEAELGESTATTEESASANMAAVPAPGEQVEAEPERRILPPKLPRNGTQRPTPQPASGAPGPSAPPAAPVPSAAPDAPPAAERDASQANGDQPPDPSTPPRRTPAPSRPLP